jgi:hypothetical protein
MGFSRGIVGLSFLAVAACGGKTSQEGGEVPSPSATASTPSVPTTTSPVPTSTTLPVPTSTTTSPVPTSTTTFPVPTSTATSPVPTVTATAPCPVPTVPCGMPTAAPSTPPPPAQSGDLELEYACGIHSIWAMQTLDFVSTGEVCGLGRDLNTFALRLTGADSARYSAVVRCAYIRYDNGTVVGDRVVVEARDGQWCHELALEQIDMKDRMLLTDVSFAVEAIEETAPARGLSLRINGRLGWSDAVSAEKPLCLYVAHEEYGAAACGSLRQPLPYCTCPPGEAWQDFANDVELSFAY